MQIPNIQVNLLSEQPLTMNLQSNIIVFVHAFSDSGWTETEWTPKFCCRCYSCCSLYLAVDCGCCTRCCILQAQVSEIVGALKGEAATAAPVCCQFLGKGESRFLFSLTR